MPPSPPTFAAFACVRALPGVLRSELSRAILCALATSLFANAAVADTTTTPIRRPAPISIVPVKKPNPAPRVPQTRYTVRKQIESIEPISWLERYGKVRVREIKH